MPFGKEPTTTVKPLPGAEQHPLLSGLPADGFYSPSTLYRTLQTAASVTPLLVGQHASD